MADQKRGRGVVSSEEQRGRGRKRKREREKERERERERERASSRIHIFCENLQSNIKSCVIVVENLAKSQIVSA